MLLKSLPPAVLALAVAGCDQPKTPPTPAAPTAVTAASDEHDDHDHGAGPHGGTVFDLGRYHAELTVDHAGKSATVYILSGNLKRPVAVAADKLTVTLADPAVSFDLPAVRQPTDPAGKASQFTGTHPALATVKEFAGTVLFTDAGKELRGRFAEEAHGHGHK